MNVQYELAPEVKLSSAWRPLCDCVRVGVGDDDEEEEEAKMLVGTTVSTTRTEIRRATNIDRVLRADFPCRDKEEANSVSQNTYVILFVIIHTED